MHCTQMRNNALYTLLRYFILRDKYTSSLYCTVVDGYDYAGVNARELEVYSHTLPPPNTRKSVIKKLPDQLLL